ncbi:MAG TPA: glycoside hydrolase family 2 TIM barrel-domain containing protein [Acidimicrobiales bacterium]|nr:glycoside hydrolase family 2 TIM barrel-domain containing protein [Acidimicrobiales bacterium]
MTLSTGSWMRPEAVSFNRRPMTTFLRDASDVLSLDGDWSFMLLDRPGGAVRAEATVAVPGCWTMQGVGDPPQYTNIQMPFPGPPPSVPVANPTGVYRRRVEVPSAWDGRRIVLHVGGAESVLYVSVDGTYVGMGTDSRLPQEFDLTDLVAAGSSCELELTVVRWSAATYLEDQDHWFHAGLHRSVLLYSTPAVHILDVHAVADFDPLSGDGQLDVRVSVGGPPRVGARLRVLVDDEPVGEIDAHWEHADEPLVNAYLFDGRGGALRVAVPGVTSWSAERPHLHRLGVELVHDGSVLDAVSLRVGFRRVEIRGHELLVNGRAVLIKGVNRHDHDPRAGKAVSRASIRHDIALMKAHNLNAVRTSHYPNDPYLYDVCDELGVYVVDEANVETHAYLRSLTKAPAWGPAILERISRMALRDKNHPCVIMWSLGNESGCAPIFDAGAAWLRAYDPSRPVHYENGYLEGVLDGLTAPESWHVPRRETDVIPPMYPPIEDLETWAFMAPPGRPLIMCEYEHAMNNSCGDLDRYWATIRSTPGLQGGFIWDWVDQALIQRRDDGNERLAYGGDFGDEPNDGAFCLNGLVAADRTPHPSLLEAKVVLQPIRFEWSNGGTVRVTNEHDFTDLSDVGDLDWTVTVDGDEVVSGSFGQVALGPGASTELRVPVPSLDLDGWQIAHATVRVGDIAVGQTELARSQARRTGGEAVALPTRLSVWRAPIDNERFGPRHAERWQAMGLPTAHERLDLRTHVDGATVTHEVDVPDGWDDIPRVGVRIELPPDVASVEWLGRGPHECYTDRHAGASFGRWRSTVDGWGTPYVHPQANGNRTGVRALRFFDRDDVVVLCVDELADLDVTVSRWTDEELDTVTHYDELPPSTRAYLWIDARHRGVGSAAVGPDVSAAHRVGPGPYRWSYRIHQPGK